MDAILFFVTFTKILIIVVKLW